MVSKADAERPAEAASDVASLLKKAAESGLILNTARLSDQKGYPSLYPPAPSAGISLAFVMKLLMLSYDYVADEMPTQSFVSGFVVPATGRAKKCR